MTALALALLIGVTQPQTPPNPGAAEAKPQTVTSPGGATTLPAGAPQSAPASYGDPANDDVAAPKLGPQQDLGRKINRTVHYVTVDEIAPPVITNLYSAGGAVKGNNGRSYTGRAAFELPLGTYDAYIGAEGRRYDYNSLRGGGTVRESDADVRAGLKVGGPRLYASVSYLNRGSTLEPRERGLGYGIEKLADVDQNFSIHGGVWYYPNVGGNYRNGARTGDISYHLVRYYIGASFQAQGSPLFLDAGFLGDNASVRTDAPNGFKHQGPYVGLGVHF